MAGDEVVDWWTLMDCVEAVSKNRMPITIMSELLHKQDRTFTTVNLTAEQYVRDRRELEED